MSLETQSTNPDFITIPEGLLTERTETRPEAPADEVASRPEVNNLDSESHEEILPKSAETLHVGITDSLSPAFKAEHIRKMDEMARMSAVAVKAAQDSQNSTNA